MDLRQALAQVSEIREHLVRTEQFRGYRSSTVALSGIIGLIGAIAQSALAPNPADNLNAYLALWTGAAAINLAIIGGELWLRTRAASSSLARRPTLFAVEQFAPSVLVGGLVTVVISRQAPESAWMLPGLWSVIFSLGVFASCRLFPRPVSLAGFWYLSCGALALAWGPQGGSLSPWTMGFIFGGGQLLTALLLYFVLERTINNSD